MLFSLCASVFKYLSYDRTMVGESATCIYYVWII